jgi:hypothetical protein
MVMVRAGLILATGTSRVEETRERSMRQYAQGRRQEANRADT